MIKNISLDSFILDIYPSKAPKYSNIQICKSKKELAN